MKVLLFELGGQREEYNEPLGICLISSYLYKYFNEGEIEIVTKWYFEEKNLPDRDYLSSFDLIGLSLQIGSLDKFNKVYSEYITIDNKPIMVVGNMIPTFAYKNLLEKYSDVICVRGEGEISFLEICKMIHNNKFLLNHLSGIPNIAFSSNDQIHVTNSKPIDLNNSLEYDRPFINFIYKNGGIARIEGSRGCHWGKCEFCCIKEKYGDSIWRPAPVSSIIYQLEQLGKSGILSPYFTDEDFFGNDYKRGIYIAESIIQAKMEKRIPQEMNFFLSVLANDVKNDNGFTALSMLKKAGLREVFIGIESGAKNQLKRFGKKANLDINKIAIERASNIGLQIDVGFILFDPLLTFPELLSNISYIGQLKLNKADSRSLKSLRVQPSTPLKDKYSKIISDTIDLDNLLYPYNFVDSKVSAVHELYSKWEEELKDEVYLLQAASRGEVKSELMRNNLKEQLASVRDIDFQVLEKIVLEIDRTDKINLSKLDLERFRVGKVKAIEDYMT